MQGPLSLKLLDSQEKQQEEPQTFLQLMRPGDSPFPVAKLPLRSINQINLIFFILNTYVFFVKSKHCYIISVLVYIYGMLLLGNNSPAIRKFTKTNNLNPIYMANIFVWFCEFKGNQIEQIHQTYAISVFVVFYFRNFVLMFIVISYASIFTKRPTFRDSYVISNMTTLRNVIPKTLVGLTGLRIFQVFRYSFICISIVQNWKLGQQRHYITIFRLLCQLYIYFVPRFSSIWIALHILQTVLYLWNQWYYNWDLQRILQGSKAYPNWVYVVTWIINIIGRTFWIYELIAKQNLYCREAIVLYHQIIWNLIRVDKNYSKNILKKVKPTRMTLKFITGRDNTISFIQSILDIKTPELAQNTMKMLQK